MARSTLRATLARVEAQRDELLQVYADCAVERQDVEQQRDALRALLHEARDWVARHPCFGHPSYPCDRCVLLDRIDVALGTEW